MRVCVCVCVCVACACVCACFHCVCLCAHCGACGAVNVLPGHSLGPRCGGLRMCKAEFNRTSLIPEPSTPSSHHVLLCPHYTLVRPGTFNTPHPHTDTLTPNITQHDSLQTDIQQAHQSSLLHTHKSHTDIDPHLVQARLRVWSVRMLDCVLNYLGHPFAPKCKHNHTDSNTHTCTRTHTHTHIYPTPPHRYKHIQTYTNSIRHKPPPSTQKLSHKPCQTSHPLEVYFALP